VIDGEEVLASLLYPLDRTAQAPGQIRHEEVLGIELAADAEAAADVRLHEVDLCLIQAQQRGQRAPIEVGDLRRPPHQQALRVAVPLGQ